MFKLEVLISRQESLHIQNILSHTASVSLTQAPSASALVNSRQTGLRSLFHPCYSSTGQSIINYQILTIMNYYNITRRQYQLSIFLGRRGWRSLLMQSFALYLEGVCFYNIPNVFCTIWSTHSLRLLAPLSKRYHYPIISLWNRMSTSCSVCSAKGLAGWRIVDFADQHSSCEGIEDGIDKSTRCHQSCPDTVKCQGDFCAIPNSQARGRKW